MIAEHPITLYRVMWHGCTEAHIHDDPRDPDTAAKYQRRALRFVKLLESSEYNVLFLYTLRRGGLWLTLTKPYALWNSNYHISQLCHMVLDGWWWSVMFTTIMLKIKIHYDTDCILAVIDGQWLFIIKS